MMLASATIRIFTNLRTGHIAATLVVTEGAMRAVPRLLQWVLRCTSAQWGQSLKPVNTPLVKWES
jgi:hypothetical protein